MITCKPLAVKKQKEDIKSFGIECTVLVNQAFNFLSQFNLSAGEKDGAKNSGVTPALSALSVLPMDMYSHFYWQKQYQCCTDLWNSAIFFLAAA